jgi:hypothetical protein
MRRGRRRLAASETERIAKPWLSPAPPGDTPIEKFNQIKVSLLFGYDQIDTVKLVDLYGSGATRSCLFFFGLPRFHHSTTDAYAAITPPVPTSEWPGSFSQLFTSTHLKFQL